MNCPRCQFENGEDAFFCMKCGEKLYIAVLQRKDAVGIEDTYYLLPIPYTIGRDPGNQIVLADSKVSRKHARIIYENNHFVISDLGSKNGVIVNGEIVNQVDLNDGDFVQIGEDKYLFKNEAILQRPGLIVEDQTLGPILRVLARINQTFHSPSSMEETLNLILDCVMELTRFQHGFLFVYDESGMTKHEFTRNMSDPGFDDISSSYSATAVDKAIKSGRIVFEKNTLKSEDFRNQKSIINLRLMSLICIPIVSMHHNPTSEYGVKVGERTILGVIYVDNQSPTKVFSERRMEILQTLANQAALAVENVLIRRERLEKNKIDKDLSLAHKIQQNLLPSGVPVSEAMDIAGINEPCRQIGGDYYDFLKLKDGNVAVVIADVCGKGAPAALLMSALQATLKSQVQYISKIDEIVTNLNSAMMQNAPSNRFITLFIGVYHAEERLFEYVSCGHDPAILMRTSGEIELLKSTGLPLGIQHPPDIRRLSTHLQQNDLLLLYTDGVTEARNSDGKQFGLEKLKAVLKTVGTFVEDGLSCDDILDGLLEQIYQFTENTERRDDITMVALRAL
ncbi:SpoIIE family protein phosphatase [candidate division KSB1 bacterium]|nr:SpoIIE family protein phosphatase [candidate division KSB1 bacterium]